MRLKWDVILGTDGPPIAGSAWRIPTARDGASCDVSQRRLSLGGDR